MQKFQKLKINHDQYVTTPGCNKLSEKIFNIKIIKQI